MASVHIASAIRNNSPIVTSRNCQKSLLQYLKSPAFSRFVFPLVYFEPFYGISCFIASALRSISFNRASKRTNSIRSNIYDYKKTAYYVAICEFNLCAIAIYRLGAVGRSGGRTFISVVMHNNLSPLYDENVCVLLKRVYFSASFVGF